MAELLSPGDWQLFVTAINDAGDTFNKMPITWHRFKNFTGPANEFMEDVEVDGTYEDIELLCLFSDNYFHSLPINSEGNFDFNEAMDRFIYNGMVYKSDGFTDMSQAEDQKLLVMLILRKEEVNTGTNILNNS